MAKIAFLLADDFEDSEYQEPRKTLEEAGHDIDVIGIEAGEVTGKKGATATVDMAAGDAPADEYDALVIPGGYSPDKLRVHGDVVELTRTLAQRDILVAAVCHAPSLLIEAGVVEGRTMTSWPSVRTDLANAGATVVDEEVCIDGRFITSRKPDDLPAFGEAILRALADS